jgi:hypothetical protein
LKKIVFAKWKDFFWNDTQQVQKWFFCTDSSVLFVSVFLNTYQNSLNV